MTDRKQVSKTVRFEVFKRDSFACQYCGRKAPDVLLVIDHIEPVSKGGTNDLLNLITACNDCNAGKSDRQLTDSTVFDKQRQQLEELQERKEQIEMMFLWQKGLLDRAAVDCFLVGTGSWVHPQRGWHQGSKEAQQEVRDR